MALGKPYAGKLHVRFDEGRVGPIRTPMALEYNMSESLISIIKLFDREGSVNCTIVRSCGEQTWAILAGRNDSEPHLMSLDRFRTSEPSLWIVGEGRRESPGAPSGRKQLKGIHRTGGVGEDGMSGSVSRRGREILQILQEVGVLNSSVEVFVMKMERRRGTCANVIHRRKGSGDGEQ